MPLNLTEDSLRNLITKHFDREVARTKMLKTGQVHVAFVDGTMGVYSPEEIEKWAEDEMQSALEDEKVKRLCAQMDQDLMLYGACAYHYPDFKRVHPLDIPKLL